MKTESVLLNNLCVPCACRCRYCLLSWDGKPVGVPWERGNAFAVKFKEGLNKTRPELSFGYSFGYSMEHPNLREALRFLRSIGSPQAEYLQCDGMRMRDVSECRELAAMLKEEGVKRLNFTVYGEREYHDRFAARRGDFELVLRMMSAAERAGLEVSAGIPITKENIGSVNELACYIKKQVSSCELFLFIPHEEGRGKALSSARLTEDDLLLIDKSLPARFNRALFRPEREWLNGFYMEETKRQLIISIRSDNIGRYEAMTPDEIVAEVEALDDAYYAAYPSFYELAGLYGDMEGGKLYRQRDLFYRYRRIYSEEHGINPYDITDECRSGTRRY